MEMERRYVPVEDLELREDGDAGAQIEGYPALFRKWTNIGPFMERVMPGAFEETIEQDDVRALLNHDPNMVLGRTSNGSLTLTEERKGLFMRNTPNPDTTVGRDALAWVRRGDITGQSYGFNVMEDSWETKDVEGEPVEHRTIKKVKLFDVGPVTFPAEEQTSIIAKSVNAIFEQRMAQKVSESVPDGSGDEGGGDDVVDHDVTPQFTSKEGSLRLKEYEIEMGR